MQNLDLYTFLYTQQASYLTHTLLYIDVFQELAGKQKRLSFFMNGRNIEVNTWMGYFEAKLYCFEIKPIPPVAAVACNKGGRNLGRIRYYTPLNFKHRNSYYRN